MAGAASEPAPRVYREHEDAVAVILSATADMIAQVGHEAFSLRKLAQTIGYSPAAIYRHFTNKEELIDAVIEAGFLELREGLLEVTARDLPPKQCVAECLYAYVAFANKKPSLYKMLFVDRDRAGSRSPMRSGRGPTYQVFHNAVVRALAEHPKTQRDPRHVAMAIWASIHGVVTLHLTRPIALSRKELSAVVETVLESSLALFEAPTAVKSRRS